MKVEERDILTTIQKEAILQLWNNEYPRRLTYRSLNDFENYLHKLSHQKHLLMRLNDQIIGWAFQFVRDNETWFAVIIHADHQLKGLGKAMITELKNRNSELVAWVIDHHEEMMPDGRNYKSPLEFYLKNDFDLIPGIRLETDFISAVKIKWGRDIK